MNLNSYLVAALYGAVFVAFLLWYIRSRSTKQAAHSRQLAESIEAGLTEPASLHPLIDPNRCIGSGACAKACPEEALGIVRGKAVLVNASVCIGHGACEAACPVQAIKLVFGTEKRGMDIPQVKPNFETNVPGIFIAGELGGMGLVRKSAEQGRQAMKSIRERRGGAAPLDVVIVGSGPAGIAAGLGAVEQKMKYVIIEQEDSLGGSVYQYPRNKITMTSPVQLPIVGKLRIGEIRKEALLEIWQGIVKKTGLKIQFKERMETIERVDPGFIVKTTKRAYTTRSVLLAIGRRGTPRKLGVPGEELPKVVYCLIDPEQYRNQAVLVVGGGDSALEAAIAIGEEPGTKVTLSYRSEAFGRVKPKNRERLAKAEANRQVKVILNSTVDAIGAKDVTIKQGDRQVRIRNDAVIVCAGGVLPIDLLKKVGIAFDTKHGTA
jgi:thioredoxin reductase (NADPH)